MPVRIGDVAPDYVLTVKSSTDKNKDAALLYCIDSHSYTQVKSVPGYDWIKFDQIAWYREQSKTFTEIMAVLRCLHWLSSTLLFLNIRMLDGRQNRMFGCKAEMVCCPTTNSGFLLRLKSVEM